MEKFLKVTNEINNQDSGFMKMFSTDIHGCQRNQTKPQRYPALRAVAAACTPGLASINTTFSCQRDWHSTPEIGSSHPHTSTYPSTLKNSWKTSNLQKKSAYDGKKSIQSSPSSVFHKFTVYQLAGFPCDFPLPSWHERAVHCPTPSPDVKKAVFCIPHQRQSAS